MSVSTFYQNSVFFYILGISIKKWPLRGLTNHLSYKNIYCAICNGVDPYYEMNLYDQEWIGSEETRNSSIPAVEWWPAEINCSSDAIEEYLRYEPSHTDLINLISR